MDVKTAHFSDEQTVNNINRGKCVELLFARLNTESISTSNFWKPNIETKYVSYLAYKHIKFDDDIVGCVDSIIAMIW